MNNLKSMSKCPSGTRGQVLLIEGGCSMKHRLADMGVFPGAFIEILQNEGGPVVLKIGEGRLALGRQMADRVLIA
nr:FeoA family protein [uncultured Dethiosulfovibrio sp.]